jgi:flavodoxin
MKIGMIVYSQTGNTYSVATKLMERLSAAGHEVSMQRIQVAGEVKPGAKDLQFETLPDPRPYDALVFGSPVMAFTLSPVMARFLEQMPAVANKKAACLVTEAFPYAWLGGNRAVARMTKALKAKGAAVCGSGIINWNRSRREEQIEEVVDRLSRLF